MCDSDTPTSVTQCDTLLWNTELAVEQKLCHTALAGTLNWNPEPVVLSVGTS